MFWWLLFFLSLFLNQNDQHCLGFSLSQSSLRQKAARRKRYTVKQIIKPIPPQSSSSSSSSSLPPRETTTNSKDSTQLLLLQTQSKIHNPNEIIKIEKQDLNPVKKSWLLSSFNTTRRKRRNLVLFGTITAILLLRSWSNVIMKHLFLLTSWYLHQIETKPLLTKAFTTGFLGLGGDILAQYLEHTQLKQQQQQQQQDKDVESIISFFNVQRGWAVFFDGLLLSGPLLHFGFALFEHILPVSGKGLFALVHVLADTLFLDSLFVMTTFWTTGLFEGHGIGDLMLQFRRDYGAALVASWITSLALLPLEFLSFVYLPLSLRTLAVNVTDLIWDTVVSFMTHKSRVQINNNKRTNNNNKKKKSSLLPSANSETRLPTRTRMGTTTTTTIQEAKRQPIQA